MSDSTSKVLQIDLIDRGTENDQIASELKLESSKPNGKYCTECNRHFETKTQFKFHMNAHLYSGKYKCEQCSFAACTKDAIAKHRRMDHGVKVNQCYFCGNIYTDDETFATHIRCAHNGEQPVGEICEKCGKRLFSRQSMKNHIDSKCGTEKQFKCDICEQRYMTKLSLAAHRAIHEGTKSACCSYCGKKFVSTGQLKVHERMHTKEKPFKCNICNKGFSYRESLVTHASVHTGIKPYLCTNCERTFSCIGNLLKHRKAKRFSCGLPEFCQETKLVVPRTRTRTSANASISFDSSSSSPTKEYSSIKIEFLDENVEALASAVDDEDSSHTNIKAEGEEQKVAKDGSKFCNVIVGDIAEENEEIELTDRDNDLILTNQSANDDEVQIVESIEYDEEFDQFTVEVLTCPDDITTDDVPFTTEVTQIPSFSTMNASLQSGNEAIQKPTKLEIELNTDVHFEHDGSSSADEQSYECSSCNLELSTTEHLMDHLRTVHNVVADETGLVQSNRTSVIECSNCDELFYDRSDYDKHLENHGDHVTGSTKEVLAKTKDQILAAHAVPNHVCSKCGKKCFSRSALRQHETSNCGVSPQYQCKDCKRFYHSPASLKRHSSVHTGSLPFLCSDCGKAFRTKGQYVVHVRKHTGEKPFQCHLCFKSFAYRQSLVTHITTHTGDKPFQCHCGRSFSCVKNLLSHRNTFSSTCGKLPANTKPKIQIGVIRGELYIGDKSN